MRSSNSSNLRQIKSKANKQTQSLYGNGQDVFKIKIYTRNNQILQNSLMQQREKMEMCQARYEKKKLQPYGKFNEFHSMLCYIQFLHTNGRHCDNENFAFRNEFTKYTYNLLVSIGSTHLADSL